MRLGSILLANGVVAYEDWAPLSTWEDLFRPFTIPWDNLHNLGSPVPLTTIGNIIYNLPLLALATIVGSAATAVKVQFLLMLWLSGLTWFLYFKFITSSLLGGFLGGLWMMVNPFIYQRFELAHGTIIFAYILSPFLLLSSHKLIFQDDIKGGIEAFALSIIIGLLSPAMFFMNILLIILLSLSLFVTSRASINRRMFRLSNSLILISTSLLLIIFLIVILGAGIPCINMIRAEEAGIPGDIINGLLGYPSLIVAIPFTSALGIYAYRTRRQPSEITLVYLKAILISSALTAAFIILALQPRGQVFRLLFYHVPGLQLFREVRKLLFLPIMGMGLLLAKLGQHLNGELRRVRLQTLAVASSIIILSLIRSPSPVKLISLPEDYLELRSFLGARRENFRVAYLPPASWATSFSWADHYFLDPAVVFMPKPTIFMVSEQEQTPGSSFIRWLYSSFYQGRTSRLGSLMGLLGVRYIILRPDADTPKTHDGLRWMGAEETMKLLPYQRDLKEVSRFGGHILYETPTHYPVLYSADHIVATLGDRNILNTMLEAGLPIWNAAIVPLEDAQSPREILGDSRLIAVQGGDPTPLLAAISGTKIRPWMDLEFSSNPSDAWYSGGAAWWYERGRVNSAPEGFAITTGENTLYRAVKVPKRGNYLLLINAFSSSSDSRGLEVSLGSFRKTLRPSINASADYTWEALGPFELEEGEYLLSLRGLGGLNAVSTIYLVTPEDLEDARMMLRSQAHSGLLDLVLLLEDGSWISEQGLTSVSSPRFSLGTAVRFTGSLSSNFTTMWEDDYFILARMGGRESSISVSIDGTILEELKTWMEEPGIRVYGPIRLKEGKHRIELSSRNEALLDLVAISTSNPNTWLRTDPKEISYSENPSEVRFQCSEDTLLVYNMDHLNLWLLEEGEKIGDMLGYGAIFKIRREGECILRYNPLTRPPIPQFSYIAIPSIMLLIGLLMRLRGRDERTLNGV